MKVCAWVRGVGKLTSPELYALAVAAERIGTSPTNLATVISFETGGTFSPSEPNRSGSGARGTIQFMPATMCALLGMPDTPDNRKAATATFVDMTFVEQLEYVVKYFSWFNKNRKLDTLERLYCAIFWPAAIDKPDDYVIGVRGGAVYRQNAGFDTAGNKDGKITRLEICRAVRHVLASAADKPLIEIPEPEGGDTSPFTVAERLAVLALINKTSDEATEEFRKGKPAGLDDDDEEPPPATPRNS